MYPAPPSYLLRAKGDGPEIDEEFGKRPRGQGCGGGMRFRRQVPWCSLTARGRVALVRCCPPGISREAFALFMQPESGESMDVPRYKVAAADDVDARGQGSYIRSPPLVTMKPETTARPAVHGLVFLRGLCGVSRYPALTP